MIVVDTNVVSEFMGTPPAPLALEWLNAQDAALLYLTTVSIAEICFGLQMMPESKRRRLLSEEFEQFVAVAFDSRVLPFDEQAARVYGSIRAYRKEAGRPMSTLDAQIAAIARSKSFAIATRNAKDFEQCQIELINPFGETQQ